MPVEPSTAWKISGGAVDGIDPHRYHRPRFDATPSGSPDDSPRPIRRRPDHDQLASADLERAVRGFYEAVVSRRIIHAGDLMLTEHLAVTQRGEPGLLALRRRSATVDMDGAVAAVLAHYGLAHLPAVEAQDWIAY